MDAVNTIKDRDSALQPPYMGPIIGHRGAAAFAPENTIESFALAHDFGCRAVEFDVVLSADGEPFLFHDETLNRTTNAAGAVGLASSKYLKTLDAGSWFSKKFHDTRIPTLRETLNWLLARQMTANVEIKPTLGTTEATVKAVLSDLNDIWPKHTPLPLVSSFDVHALHLCREQHATLPLAFLLKRWQPDEIKMAETLGCVAINISRTAINPSRVQALKQKGFMVYVYTVNHQSLISMYSSWGVDGVFSDYPRWVWKQPQGRIK